jgi:hypothetical protein
MENLSCALKEWAIAVEALEQGNTIVLLRKGGIREHNGQFRVEQTQVLLYPTYEHQKPHLLKTEYRDSVQSVISGWHPDKIRLNSVAEITDIFKVTEATILESLLPFHIWNSQFAEERFQWKPKSPLYVLLLRVFRLAQSQMIPYQLEYGGCRSWIDLGVAIDLEGATPVLNDDAYLAQVEQIRDVIEPSW